MSNIGIMINGTRILNREKKRLMNTPMGKEHHALTVKMKEGKRLLKQYMNVSKLVQSAASDYEISSTHPSDTSFKKPFLRMATKGTDIIFELKRIKICIDSDLGRSNVISGRLKEKTAREQRLTFTCILLR